MLLLSSLLGCSGAEEEPGALRGRFVQNVARMKDGRSEVTYTLFRGQGRSDRRELVFDKAPDLLSDTEIEVWGTESAGRIKVDRWEVMGDAPRKGPLGKSREALIDAAPIAPTNMVMVMVDTGGGAFAITREQMHAELFSEEDPTSLVHYYRENSYGMHELTGQVAPGTYTYAMTGCDYDAMTDALTAQVHADTGVPEFDLYLWYFQDNDDCGWSGLSSGQDTYYNGSSGCVVLAQEPGHSFGLAHSSSLTCTGADGMPAAFADDPQASCMHSEYGNGYDTMGGGCRHFSGYQKVYRTYLQGCNVAQVQASGTFTLHPIETPCNGVQVIQVPMPKVRPFASEGGGSGDRTTQLAYYNVELRAPIGAFDGSTNGPMVPSVLVNAAPDWRVFGQGGGGRGRGNTRGEHIWLLDMAPTSTGTGTGGGRGGGRGGNGTGHALALGQTYTDPAGGVSITTEAVSETSATIRVDITAPLPPLGGSGGGGSGTAGAGGAVIVPPGTVATCLDDRPLMLPGPTSCDGSYGGSGNVAGSGGMAGSGGLGGAVTAGSGPIAAGAGGLAGGGNGGNGGAAGRRVDVVTPDGELDSGCGCRVAGAPGSNGSASLLALLGAAGAVLARRGRGVAQLGRKKLAAVSPQRRRS
ncbi:MAG TPA: MYXO-CTERM sorting domain-containing protein [Polyangiaceae bacterium]